MSLESANLINELDPAWPTATDPVSQGDDHVRMIKHVLQTQFPNLTDAVTASSNDLNKGANPAGSLIMYGGATVPTGYLMCNGSAVSRTTYSDLYIAIGTAYGDGDGSNTFNVPDMRDKIAGGAGVNALASEAGKDTHTAADLLKHTHTMDTKGEHIHPLLRNNSSANPVNDFSYDYVLNSPGPSYNNGSPQTLTKAAGDHKHAIAETGSDTVDNRQATLYVNYIIKT